MTLLHLADAVCLTPVTVADASLTPDGVYVGDLLSRVMGRIKKNNVWVTIMTNKNVIAVAGLTEAAAVILAEGVALTADALEAAKENHVNVYATDLPAYELCRRLAAALGG